MDEDQLRRRVAEARVARVGTVDEQGRAHLVPIVFVVDGDRLYSATDDGPVMAVDIEQWSGWAYSG
jgi:nitroimidazol reductase NimA-like FMN-containing flavoprotein (pyridoxamine 5'-phosphate oxidase superfamily)